MHVPDQYCTLNASACTGTLVRTNGPCNGICAPYCDGVVLSPGAKENEYITQKTYPGPGSYKLCLTLANRNAGVINIPNSVNQLFYVESALTISPLSGPNNSAICSYPPVALVCLSNGCFSYNSGASDPDGDSLAYRIMPYTDMPGATLPGNVLTVNPATGTVTWCDPFYTGDYNFVLRVEEWRDEGTGSYTMSGYTDRDIQFILGSCTGIYAADDKAAAIAVFPNPVQKEITISVGAKHAYVVELTDITGRVLKTLIAGETIDGTETLQLNDIAPGVYLLGISSSDGCVIRKIIKQ